MGYYTHYTLEIESDDKSLGLRMAIEADSDYELQEVLREEGYFHGKWYTHEEDMKSISKGYPSVIFHLRGEGENNEDIWEKHFQNGRMQVCNAQIVIPPFDPLQLK